MERRSVYYMASMDKMTPALYEQLLNFYGTPENAWQQRRPVLPPEVLSEWEYCHREDVLRDRDLTYDRMEKDGIRFLMRSDPEFPPSFLCLADPPVGLFLRGRLPGRREERVSVIGARKCSPYGKACAAQLASRLAEAGVWVVSGMALGIDAWAQWSALDAGGPSLAVLGSGIDVCYPSSHQRLYETLSAKGGVISEYPPGTKALPFHFPRRNRLISAISSVIVVVEAQSRSGTLITVDHALEQGKEVLAYPGRIDDVMSQGCLGLLRQGAGICLGAEDVFRALGWSDRVIKERCAEAEGRQLQRCVLSDREKKVYHALTVEPVSVDRLMLLTGLSMGELMVDLWSLECKKLCAQASGNTYQKL